MGLSTENNGDRQGYGKPPTLADIARLAGVAESTVSRVLNGRYDAISITPATRERVLKAARALHYRPNLAARTLASRRAAALGIYTYDLRRLRNPHNQDIVAGIVAGISEGAAAQDASLVWYFSPGNQRREFDVRVMQDGRVDAGIVLEDREMTADVLSHIAASSLPVVLVGDYRGTNVSFVGSDDRAGAAEAARYLLELGHRRFLCLGGRGPRAGLQRVEGFMSALEAAGVPLAGVEVDIDFRAPEAYKAMATYAARPDHPTAVFAVNDLCALAAVQAASDAGLRVPADISIIGFNDLSFAPYCTPALTSVQRPLYQMGLAASRLAFALANSETQVSDAERQIIFPTALMKRQTCAPPPA